MTTAPVVTITDELVAELEQLAGKATPGPWEVAETDSEGSYGSGSDTSTGFTAYGVCAGEICLFDTLNSDSASIVEELDGESRYAWDATGKANAHYIARANPATILALLTERAELKRDADRYRFIREQSAGDGEFTNGICIDLWRDGCGKELTHEEADNAIDTTMQERQE